MALCGMHDERVAQPDVAGVTRGRDLGQMVALSREGTGCAEEFNRAVIAKYQSRGGQVTAQPHPRRRIVGSDVWVSSSELAPSGGMNSGSGG